MDNQEQRYNKLRRQKINLMLNEEERKTITEKAIKYGYGDCLAEYIRAAAIYENIYVEDVEGKKQVCEKISEFIEILREILKEQKSILKSVVLNKSDIEIISQQNLQIIKMIDSLSNLIVSTLSVNAEKKIQQREKLIYKYKVDGAFLDKLLRKERDILTVRPSNLHKPNEAINIIVFLDAYTRTFDLNNLDIADFINEVNHYRNVAMQKKIYISFIKDGNNLKIGVVMNFNNLIATEKFMKDSGCNDAVFLNNTIMNEGDIYTSNS